MLAIVTTFYSKIGGVSTFIKEVELNTIKINSNVIIISPDIAAIDILKHRIRITKINRLLTILDLFHKLLRYKPSKIQCHGTWYLQLGCIFYKYFYKALGKDITLVFIKHSDIVLNRGSFKLIVFRLIDNLGDSIVFVSEYLKKKYMSYFGYTFNGNALVIHPGCSKPHAIDESIVEEITAMKKGKWPVITYIGLFEYEGKVSGLCLLLESVCLLKEIYKDIILIICGYGSKEYIIKSKIKELNLCENVIVLNNIVNVNNVFTLSNVHCHISFQEGFPLVVLEALAAGVPVVATSVGDLQKVSVNGLFIVKTNPVTICKKISDLIENPTYVDKMKIMEKYNWANTAETLYNIG